MAKGRRAKSKRLVLDIGTSAVRLCELSQTKAGYQLTKYAQREFPIDPSMDEAEKKRVRIETLQLLLKESKTRATRTIFGVPGQSVFTRLRALPPVQEFKVTQIVRYEIQQQIPFALDQIALGYQVLNRTESGGYDVLMAAIKVDVVDKHIELLTAAGRRVEHVDVCPLACYNWLKHTGEFGEEGECIALIDLGATTTDIVVERDKQFRFTRSLNIGGNDITQAIAKGFSITYAEAEKLKRERGFAPTGDAQRDGKGGEVIGQVLQRLVGEINRSLAYFRSQPGGGPVQRIIVTGGGACLRNIIPYLQRQLGLEVRIAQPLAGLAVGPGAQAVNDHPEQAVTVLGLALRTQEPVTIEIDLIPPRVLELARSKEQTLYWVLVLVTLGLIISSVVPMKANENKQYVDQAKMLEGIVRQYDPALLVEPISASKKSEAEDSLRAADGMVNTKKNQLAALDSEFTNRTYWLNYLVDINAARPSGKGVWLSTFETTYIGTVPQQALAPAAATPKKSDDEDEDRGGLSRGFASLMGSGLIGGAGGGGAPGGAGASGVPSTGFPGVAPAGMVSSPDGQAQPAKPLEPNGIRIGGYADSPATLQAFIENLRATETVKQLFFDDKFSDPVPWSQMAQAKTASSVAPAAAATGRGGRDDDDDRRGGLGRGLTGGSSFGAATRQTGSSYGSALEPNVIPFWIDLQVLGTPLDEKGNPIQAEGAAPVPVAGGAAPAPAAATNPFANLGGSGG